MQSIIKTVLSLFLLLIINACSNDEPTIVVDKNDDTYSPAKIQPVLDEWQRKTFTYFTEGSDSTTGMAYEGNERGEILTIGGSGFGLMAIIVGAERGWISRLEAAEQTRKIVRFLGKAERFKGIWSHWYNTDGTSHPFGNQIKTGDVVESSFMMAGLLTAAEYYTSNSANETEIRDSVASFWNTMNWKFYAQSGKAIEWLWYSEEDRLELDVKGWNESWITYLLALAAPENHNISEALYKEGWQSNGNFYHKNRSYYGYDLPLGEEKGGSLFFAHYSFLGLNPKLLEDNYVNYWNQNLAHTMINRHYCIAEAPAAYKYDERNWGLSACYGVQPLEYKARSPRNDDGVIASTASLASYPYTPFYSTQVLLEWANKPIVHGAYGFADSYRPETNTSEKRHLAIDQGPIVVMIENYRSGLIWDLMMKNEHVKLGLKRAGVKDRPDYKQGFHLSMINTITKEYDMMRHPDRKQYELNYFLKTSGDVQFTISNKTQSKVIFEKTVSGDAGDNIFQFDSKEIINGSPYSIKMIAPDNNEYEILTRLR